MNIKIIINVKDVNMDILKQKMKNVFIAGLNNMVGLDVMNMDMKSMKMELKLIILYVKVVIHIIQLIIMKNTIFMIIDFIIMIILIITTI